MMLMVGGIDRRQQGGCPSFWHGWAEMTEINALASKYSFVIMRDES